MKNPTICRLMLLTLPAFLISSSCFAIFDIELLGGQRSGKMKMIDVSNNTESLRTIKSDERSLGVHLSFPFLPAAFGVVLQDDNYNLDKIAKDQFDRLYDISFASGVDPAAQRTYFDFGSNSGSFTGSQWGPEVKVWLPLGKFKPHLRLAYLMGNHTLKQSSQADSKVGVTPVSSVDYNAQQKFKSTATEMGLGFTYTFLSVFAFIAEYNMGTLNVQRSTADVSYTFSQAGKATTSLQMTEKDFAEDKSTMSTTAIRLGLSFGI